MKKATKLFTGVLVPLAVAGTCLATPALALPAGMSNFNAQADAVVEEVLDLPSDVAEDVVSFAGLTMQVPAGYIAEMDGENMLVHNEACTVGIYIYDLRNVVIPEGAVLEDFFGQLVVDTDETGTAEYQGTEALNDDLTGYGYSLADGTVNYLEVFVPMPSGGFSLVEIAFEETVDQDELEAVGEALMSIGISAVAATIQAEEPGMVLVGNVAMFAGLTMELPDGYTAQASPDGTFVLYTSESENAVVSIYDMRSLALPQDGDLGAFFDQVAEASITQYEGATVENLGTEELTEGLVGYGYGVIVPDGDNQYVMVQVYIPMPDGGFDFLQMGYDAGAATQEEVDALANSLTTLAIGDLSDPAMLLGGELGFTFDVPEGFTDLGDNFWMSDDMACMVMGIGSVANVADLADPALIDSMAAEFGAEVVGSATMEAVNATIDYVLMSAEQDGTEIYVIVALVPVANEKVSVLMISCETEAAEAYDAALTGMISSINVG